MSGRGAASSRGRADGREGNRDRLQTIELSRRWEIGVFGPFQWLEVYPGSVPLTQSLATAFLGAIYERRSFSGRGVVLWRTYISRFRGGQIDGQGIVSTTSKSRKSAEKATRYS